mmetsp:Transcript_10122/g.11368  ORF Transcript_10122/g.11368 Transcript_10122/m.11368 type:complete len:103 (-) Transcript_10122:282-590(-)
MLKQMHEQRRKDFEFRSLEKIEALNKENRMMMTRLIEVSSTNKNFGKAKRKKSEFRASQSERAIGPQHRPFRPRSLNFHLRVSEDQKIREENIRMAQRLFDK